VSVQRVGDGLSAGGGVGSAAEIAGAELLLGQDLLDRLDDRGRGVVLAEMLEHHRARPDLADRVGDALPGDVRRRAVAPARTPTGICARG